jgi:hypothetical protein
MNPAKRAISANPHEAVRQYRAKGIVTLPAHGKKPILSAWATKRLSDITDKFINAHWGNGRPCNIAALLGAESGGLVDLDLDCLEALGAARAFAPPTPWTFGRVSRPYSHWLYRVAAPRPTLALKDPITGEQIVELRGHATDGKPGCVTIVPPGIRLADDELKKAEAIGWYPTPVDSADGNDEPRQASWQELECITYRVGAAVLFQRYWPAVSGGHDNRLAAAGALLRIMSPETATEFLLAIPRAHPQNEKDNDLLTVVKSTAERLAKGREAKGWPSFREAVATFYGSVDRSHLLVNCLHEWLDLAYSEHEGDAAQPLGGSYESPYILSTFASVKPRPVRYLIPNFLPLGKLVLIAGDGGNYKSALTIDIAACLTTGRPCLGMAYPPPEPCEVLLISCEDDAADTIMPRLLAHGADPRRVHRIEERDEKGKAQEFSLASYRRLESTLRKHPNIRLVVIDPAGAYIGRAGCNDHHDSELRALLSPLAETAAQRNVCICLVKHLNKGVTAKAVHKVSGSTGYINVVRGAYLILPDPDREGTRLLLPLKNNLSAPFPGRSFTSESVPDTDCVRILQEYASDLSDADRMELGQQLFRLTYCGETYISADEAVAEPSTKQPSALDQAAEWLRGYLGNGARPSIECKDAGNAALGLSRGGKWWRDSVLKDRLGGCSKKLGFHEENEWYFVAPGNVWPPAGNTDGEPSEECEECEEFVEPYGGVPPDSLENLKSSPAIIPEESCPLETTPYENSSDSCDSSDSSAGYPTGKTNRQSASQPNEESLTSSSVKNNKNDSPADDFEVF